MEASGHAGWFEHLLAELNFELWMGDAAKIAAKRVRKQKTDRLDAQHILKLMLKDDFPKIWLPSWENRDVRQLLWHRRRRTSCNHLLIATTSGWRRRASHFSDGKKALPATQTSRFTAELTAPVHALDRILDVRRPADHMLSGGSLGVVCIPGRQSGPCFETDASGYPTSSRLVCQVVGFCVVIEHASDG
jgi:transposase